jgi:hypothetical protein
MLQQTLARFQFADPAVAAAEITELVEAIFGLGNSEACIAWRFAEAEELDPAVEAALLRQANTAEDPLAVLASASHLRTRLNTLMRQRWAARTLQAAGYPAELRGLDWADLDAASRDMVRDGITHLETLNRRPRRRGPHEDHKLDTFLDELAEIYARHTGFSKHQLRLPSSEGSRFIQLAEEILRSAGGLTQHNPQAALAQRWKRYRKLHLKD